MFGIPLLYWLLALIGLAASVLFVHHLSVLGLQWLRAKPVVCVCQVQDRVGVVLRSDLTKHSKKFWRSVERHEAKIGADYMVSQSGMTLPVGPIFVFTAGSPELRTLLRTCRPERSVFQVFGPFQTDSHALYDAHKYFHGREWKGELLDQ